MEWASYLKIQTVPKLRAYMVVGLVKFCILTFPYSTVCFLNQLNLFALFSMSFVNDAWKAGILDHAHRKARCRIRARIRIKAHLATLSVWTEQLKLNGWMQTSVP